MTPLSMQGYGTSVSKRPGNCVDLKQNAGLSKQQFSVLLTKNQIKMPVEILCSPG
jgi:hypothetical protein